MTTTTNAVPVETDWLAAPSVLNPAAAGIERGASMDELRHLAMAGGIVRRFVHAQPDRKPLILDVLARGYALWGQVPMAELPDTPGEELPGRPASRVPAHCRGTTGPWLAPRRSRQVRSMSRWRCWLCHSRAKSTRPPRR